MKYTIAAILLVDGVILLWTWRAGSGSDTAAMAFALLCVTFFGSLPILAGVLSRRRAGRAQKAPGVPIKLPGARRDGRGDSG